MSTWAFLSSVSPRRLVVRAPTWFYARQYAVGRLGDDSPSWMRADGERPDVILEWRGNAARSPSTLELVER